MRTVSQVLALALFSCAPACVAPASGAIVGSDGGVTEISVSGHGEASGAPDELVADVGITLVRPKVGEAVDLATKRAKAVRDALLSAGIPEAGIQTEAYDVGPEYEGGGASPRELKGYRVTHRMRIEIRDLPRAGAVFDTVTKAGGDETTISGLRFAVKDTAKLLATAREAAWADARSKAGQLAGLAEMRLGNPVAIDESTTQRPPPFVGRVAAMAAPEAPPIQPGELTLSVNLEVRFAMEGAVGGTRK